MLQASGRERPAWQRTADVPIQMQERPQEKNLKHVRGLLPACSSQPTHLAHLQPPLDDLGGNAALGWQTAACRRADAVPAIYHIREILLAGGVMSYGASLTGAYYASAARVCLYRHLTTSLAPR